MDSIQTELANTLMTLIVALVGFATKRFTDYLKQKGIVAKLEGNKELVKIAVKAVEQTYGHLNGNEKLEIAKKEIVELMNKKKINITEKEIDLLIEAVIKEMNDVINGK